MDREPLKVLITCQTLSGRNGVEIVTRDLAIGLVRRGHRPFVYTQTAGPLADELRSVSVPVATDISDIGIEPDIIHGQACPPLTVAIGRFPNVPAIYLAHDFVAWADAPPLLPSIRRYLAVDATVRDRLVGMHGVPAHLAQLHLNAVDLNRFRPGPPLPALPAKALAFAKNNSHISAIRQACGLRNIEVDFVGGAVGRLIDAPEDWLPRYDLVFTSALSALEAMACLRAVIVCDGRGLAGMATPENFPEWRALNFGLRSLTRPVTVPALLADIDSYHAEESAAVGRSVRSQADSNAWLEALLEIYRVTICEFHADPPSAVETAKAMAQHMQLWAPRVDRRWPWLEEREELIRRLEAASMVARTTPRDQIVDGSAEFATAGQQPTLETEFQTWLTYRDTGQLDRVPERAAATFRQWSKFDLAKLVPELRNKIWALFNDQDVQLAEILCQAFFSAHSEVDDGDLHYLLALTTHMRDGDPQTSLQHYDRALACGFDVAWTSYHIGRLKLKLGDQSGVADLERARDLGGDAGREAAVVLQ